jgi:hypothetical protein
MIGTFYIVDVEVDGGEVLSMNEANTDVSIIPTQMGTVHTVFTVTDEDGVLGRFNLTSSVDFYTMDLGANKWSYEDFGSGWNIVGAAAVVARGHIPLMIGGYNTSNVLYHMQASFAPWSWTTMGPFPSARAHHGAQVLNGRMWVFGGVTNVMNDVLTNTVYTCHETEIAPGAELPLPWVMATSSSGWSPRKQFASVVYWDEDDGHRIALFGGRESSSPTNDIWLSGADPGDDWNEKTEYADWSARFVRWRGWV